MRHDRQHRAHLHAALPLFLLRRRAPVIKHGVTLLTWGGIRGGISIALALSLHDRAVHPGAAATDVIVVMIYVVVVFSVVVQGLTLGPLVRRLAPSAASDV